MPTAAAADDDDRVSWDASLSLYLSSSDYASSSLLYRFSDISPNLSWHQSLPRKVGAFGRSPGRSTVRASLWASSRQQKVRLFALALVEFSSNMCLSVMAPFFPAEAAKKGISDALSGTIFGVFPLVQFVLSPVFGKLLPRVGGRFLFLAGQFFGAGCIILFGFLDYVGSHDDNTLFIVYCFVVRGATAVGCTASTTASFVITAQMFPQDVATVFGVLETAAGLGLMVGPALGGVLFQFANYAAPFVVLGVFMMLTVPLCACLLPPQTQQEDAMRLASFSMLRLLAQPTVIVICCATVIGALVWSIIEPILQPHLVQFHLSPSVTGLLFLLMSSFYAFFAPIWGCLSDRSSNITLLLVPGFFFSVVGLLMLGPSPLFEFNGPYNALWLNIVALIILGVSVSLSVVPTYIKLLATARQRGMPENAALYSCVAGLWGSVYALGDFIGPSVGGVMYDAIGFGWTMTCAAAACALMVVILLLLWVYERNASSSAAAKVATARGSRKFSASLSMDDSPSEASPLLGRREGTPSLVGRREGTPSLVGRREGTPSLLGGQDGRTHTDPLHGTFWKSSLL